MCKEKRVVICKLILSVEGFCMYLAKLLANAESVIWKKTKVSGSSLDQKVVLAYVGSPDGHEAIAPSIGILEHSTLPLIPASSQPTGSREREGGRRG